MPATHPQFWDSRMESLPVERRRLLHDHRLHWQVRRCWDASPWHRARFEQAGIAPASFHGSRDVQRIPLLTDADLRAAASTDDAELLAVAPPRWRTKAVSENGRPDRVLTDCDEIHQADLAARALWAAGARQGRRLGWLRPTPPPQVTKGRADRAGEAIAGGAERIGMVGSAGPSSTQGGDGGLVLASVLEAGQPLVVDGTPDADASLAVWCETWPPSTGDEATAAGRATVAALWLPYVGSTAAHTCEARSGLHWADDHLLVEVLDTATHEPLADGQAGALVITELTREGSPLLRYWTGLEAAIEAAPCPCGRTSARSPFVRPLDGAQGID